MDIWEKSHMEIQNQRRRIRRQNPSFSSSLLDSIYRSIDEDNSESDEQLILYKETIRRKKQNIMSSNWSKEEENDEKEDILNFRRACMIEQWMEKKKINDKIIVRRNSMVDFDRKSRNIRDRDFLTMNSSSSSSESDFFQKPKPIRTNPLSKKLQTFISNGEESPPIPNQENGVVKKKSKASKFYQDLKKVKQPISPGARLASFLNSLFNGGSPKTKPKHSNPTMNYEDDSSRKSKSLQTSTCSSTSSFSRSCLSKTPSSRTKLENRKDGCLKRSVRFCPVSVIVDENGKSLLKDEHEQDHVMAAMANLLKKPLKFEEKEVKSYNNHNHNQRKIILNDDEDYEDDDYDDGMSCSSSDLFELDNLSVIGIERFQEELPVYETTHFQSNLCHC